MEIVTEIVVFLENRPGTLARVTEALSEKGVNILGFTVLNSLDHGALRMVVSNPDVALHLLGEHGMLAFENEVLYVKLPNKAGALSGLTRALATKRINVDYAYGSAGGAGKSHGLYLRVSNTKRALELLKSVPGIQ
ncbi:MAG: ACT domain-containing protein [Planctomycetota bacterium]